MPSPQKLVLHFGCGLGGFVLLASIFRDRLVEVALFVFFVCILADGLINGEVSYGMRDAKKVYRRRENRAVYWLIMALWSILIAAMAAALVKPYFSSLPTPT